MSDRFTGSINIGGDVTREQRDEMARIEPAVAEATVVPGGTLQVEDYEAEYGRFEALESYLIEQGIPFDAHAEGYAEFDAEGRSFRSGMFEPLSAVCTDDGVVMADATEVLTYIRRRLTEEHIPSHEDGGDAGLALIRLREMSPLPAFHIAE